MAWMERREEVGELAFTCTSDGVGHVDVRVALVTDPMRDWRARGRIIVEAGQLNALAKAAAEFVDADVPP
jgi:hypothetical protein